jgi:hypothetical protein
VFDVQRRKCGNPARAVYDAGLPAELAYSFDYAAYEEYTAFVVLLRHGVDFKVFGTLTQEIVVVVDEIYLHTRGLQSRYLDDEWVVVVVNNYVDSRKADYLVELVAAFINASVARHECSDFQPLFMHWGTIWPSVDITSDLRYGVISWEIYSTFFKLIKMRILILSAKLRIYFRIQTIKSGRNVFFIFFCVKSTELYYLCTINNVMAF